MRAPGTEKEKKGKSFQASFFDFVLFAMDFLHFTFFVRIKNSQCYNESTI